MKMLIYNIPYKNVYKIQELPYKLSRLIKNNRYFGLYV